MCVLSSLQFLLWMTRMPINARCSPQFCLHGQLTIKDLPGPPNYRKQWLFTAWPETGWARGSTHKEQWGKPLFTMKSKPHFHIQCEQ